MMSLQNKQEFHFYVILFFKELHRLCHSMTIGFTCQGLIIYVGGHGKNPLLKSTTYDVEIAKKW